MDHGVTHSDGNSMGGAGLTNIAIHSEQGEMPNCDEMCEP